MRVCFHSNLSEQEIELSPGKRHYISPLGGQVRLYWEDAPPQEVKINGQLYDLTGTAKQLLLPSGNGNEVMVIKAVLPDNSRSTYEIVPYPESSPSNEFLEVLADFQGKLREYSSATGDVTYSSLEKAIEKGLLLVSRDKYTREGTNWLLDEIEKTLPYLIRVCNRPRQYLRTDEQVLPVEVVRRIGPTALRHLASHSEHWQARTVNGLRPARLYAETAEDDLGIYENRFVKTLIDRLLSHVSRRRNEVEAAQTETNSAIDWNKYSLAFHDYRRQELLHKLLPNKLEQVEKDQKFYNRLFQRLRRIEQQLVGCTASRLYQTLKRSEPVSSPIQPTNILTMDTNYRRLFDMWRRLDEAKPKVEEAVDGHLPENLETAYAAYCQFALIAALMFKGYKPAPGSEIVASFTAEKLLNVDCTLLSGNWSIHLKSSKFSPFTVEMVFERKYETMVSIPTDIPIPVLSKDFPDTIRIEKNKLRFIGPPSQEELDRLSKLLHVEEYKFENNDWQKKQKSKREDKAWSGFIRDIQPKIKPTYRVDIQLIPLLFEFGQDSTHIDNSTRIILQESADIAKSRGLSAIVTLTPASPVTISHNARPRIVRRMVNIGDVFVEEDARLWGKKQAGIIPVSPWQINSMQRLIRLINTYTIGHDITVGEELDQCPVCDSNNIHRDRDEFECRDCNAWWTKTTCPHCKHEFGFLRPNIKSQSRNEDDITNYGSLIEHLENAAGGAAIHGYCESSTARLTEFPICPNCGRCSRQDEYKSGCLRCKSIS